MACRLLPAEPQALLGLTDKIMSRLSDRHRRASLVDFETLHEPSANGEMDARAKFQPARLKGKRRRLYNGARQRGGIGKGQTRMRLDFLQNLTIAMDFSRTDVVEDKTADSPTAWSQIPQSRV